jgi:hypothetical protein
LSERKKERHRGTQQPLKRGRRHYRAMIGRHALDVLCGDVLKVLMQYLDVNRTPQRKLRCCF